MRTSNARCFISAGDSAVFKANSGRNTSLNRAAARRVTSWKGIVRYEKRCLGMRALTYKPSTYGWMQTECTQKTLHVQHRSIRQNAHIICQACCGPSWIATTTMSRSILALQSTTHCSVSFRAQSQRLSGQPPQPQPVNAKISE